MRIVFDCDDVLADFIGGLGEAYNKKYGTNYNPEEFSPHPSQWEKLLGPEGILRMYALFNNGEYARNLKPIPRSVETIQQLHAAGDELFVATSRNGLPLDITPRWLEQEYGRIFQEVIYAQLTPGDGRPTKGEICRAVEADLAVDDWTSHVVDISSYGISCLLYDQPWNRDGAENGLITRVRGHQGIKEQVEKMRGER